MATADSYRGMDEEELRKRIRERKAELGGRLIIPAITISVRK